MDQAALEKFDEYTAARDEMFRFTHTTTFLWTVVRANEKRPGRLKTLRHVLSKIDYAGKDPNQVGEVDR